MVNFNKLVEVLKENTNDVQTYRREHKGRVPLELFEALLPVAGIYTCVEIIAETPEGVALRKRDPEIEAGLAGMYHIPGCVLTAGSTDEQLRSILGEEFGLPMFNVADLTPVAGFTLHDEPFRGSRTQAFRFTIQAQNLGSFTSGEWKVYGLEEVKKLAEEFTQGKDVEIIPHHIAGLLWYYDQDRPIIGELWKYLPNLPKVY